MKRIKYFVGILLIFIMSIVAVGCNQAEEENTTYIKYEKIKVVATLFPQYDFVREIAKDKAYITLLLPPGVEAHSYEPSPQDIVNIRKSNLFIYTGEYMEPWAHKVIESIESEDLVIVDASKDIELIDMEDHEEIHHNREEGHEDGEEEHEHEEEGHNHGEKDPHIWTDPIYAQKMVDNIVEGLSKADPENKDYYIKNGEEYKAKLQDLHEKFTETFEKTKRNKIMYSGHFALGYFAKRYGLEYISPYKGFAPDAEPTPQKVAELIDNIEELDMKVIYHEELIDPKVARVISQETGAQMMLLHGAHNVTKEELDSGISYIKIMENNLENLKQGLGYDE